MSEKKDIHARVRRRTAAVLFPQLHLLGLRAAVTEDDALGLHQGLNIGSTQLKVVVEYQPSLTIEYLCRQVAKTDPIRFTIKSKKLMKIRFKSVGDADTEVAKRACNVEFIISGGPFPTILENFDDIVHIQNTPVLPIHAILVDHLLNFTCRGSLRKASDFLDMCLSATIDEGTPLDASAFQSPEILDSIRNHCLNSNSAPIRWNALGFDTDALVFKPIPTSPVPEQLPHIDQEAPFPHQPTETSSTVPLVSNDTVITDIVARVVVELLTELGLACAIFGSAACQLYGNSRTPNDLDVLVLPPLSFAHDTEWIKKQFLLYRPRQFQWRKGKVPGATYHVLSYQFSAAEKVSHQITGSAWCKVDILVPGIMSLPPLSTTDIVWIDGLPTVPFLTLLLQKLQGWGDHLASEEQHKYEKHAVDAQDIRDLLQLAPTLPLYVCRPWIERRFLSDEFQGTSFDRVMQFCQIYPTTTPTWQMLGFWVD